ncbi:MAG: repressor LexA [Clostridia bacterium]|nr:repressor LexA [Clostridia bacterium]
MRKKSKSTYDLILNFVDDYYKKFWRSPNTREIADAIGISRATVQRYLSDLSDKGLIEYSGHRNIITDFVRQSQKLKCNPIPYAGTIPCSNFNECIPESEEYFFLPAELTGNGEFFLLKAKGNSMIDAGISDGDLVLIKMQKVAEYGQIVAFLYQNDQTTLKRYYPKENCVVLHPENKEMDDIIIRDEDIEQLQIQGIAKKVIKDLF